VNTRITRGTRSADFVMYKTTSHYQKKLLIEYSAKRKQVNLVNKANLVHNLFLVYLSISKCFGRLCVHHQNKQQCLCDTWYLLFCVDNCLSVSFHPAYQTVIHTE